MMYYIRFFAYFFGIYFHYFNFYIFLWVALFIISFLCFIFCFWKIASHINSSPPLSEDDEFYYLGSLGFYFSFLGLFSYSDITSYIFSTFNNGSAIFICFTFYLYIYSNKCWNYWNKNKGYIWINCNCNYHSYNFWLD